MDKQWKLSQEELLQELNSSMNGLTAEEAKKRLEQYGYNKLQEGKRKGVLQVFAEQFADLLVIILIIAAIISALTGGLEGTIVILAVLILNAILGTVQHFKAQKSLDSLKAMAAPCGRTGARGHPALRSRGRDRSRRSCIAELLLAGQRKCTDRGI